MVTVATIIIQQSVFIIITLITNNKETRNDNNNGGKHATSNKTGKHEVSSRGEHSNQSGGFIRILVRLCGWGALASHSPSFSYQPKCIFFICLWRVRS